MGWLYMNLERTGHKTPKAYLDNQLTWETENAKLRVLKSSAVGWGTYYAAVERTTKADGKVEVTAVVCLFKYNVKASDGMTFGYKDMDESMGPCECDCPAAILDLLTETDSEYAKEWRANCRKRLEKKLPKPGQVFLLDEPLHFGDGKTRQRFEVVKYGKSTAYRGEDGTVCRISRLKDRAFSICA